MEAIIFVGLQASGKSSFYKERLFDTHIRINLDMLRTRHRERLLLQFCIETRQPFVVDNTNPTQRDRARYIAAAKAASFRVAGYYFQSNIGDRVVRNNAREGARRIPPVGIYATAKKLQLPSFTEGFDVLYYVRMDGTGGFTVEEWAEPTSAEPGI